jgi:hypothetical protein
MSNLDEFSSSSKPPTGGLRAFVVLKDSPYANSRSESGPWGETWKHRGPYAFSIPSGRTCNLLFLTDVIPMIGYSVVTGDGKGENGWYPKIDFVRATNIRGFDSDGNPQFTNELCPFRAALGREPKLIYVAKIFEDLGYENKKEKTTVKDTVRHILIERQEILNVLCTHSQIDNLTAEFRLFKVTRSPNKKSARLGDSWVFVKSLSREIIMKQIPDAFERASKIDLEKGFPLYTMAEAVSILKLHKTIVDKHPGENRSDMSYDPAGMDAVLNGTPLVGSPLEVGKLGLSAMTAKPSGGSLESLLDADDEPSSEANPFDEVDQ